MITASQKISTLLVGAAAFAAGMPGASPVWAAAPAYCALYAREYAIDTVQPTAADLLQNVQDQAYYRCLNEDQDPALPQKSDGTDADVAALAPPQSSADDQAAATIAPRPTPAIPAASAPPAAPDPSATTPPSPATASAQTADYRPSGLTPWTSAWKTWCAANFPHSWDPATGTVLHYGSDTRELCQ